jgi:hypothetical protein
MHLGGAGPVVVVVVEAHGLGPPGKEVPSQVVEVVVRIEVRVVKWERYVVVIVDELVNVCVIVAPPD